MKGHGREMRGRLLAGQDCCPPRRDTLANYAMGKPPGPIAFHFQTCKQGSRAKQVQGVQAQHQFDSSECTASLSHCQLVHCTAP